MYKISILGATGSVGVSTLDVVKRHPEKFEVFALSANTNVTALAALCEQYQPKYAVMGCQQSAAELSRVLNSVCPQINILGGADALVDIASDPDVDVVLAAIVGAAGLRSSLAAAEAGKRLLLANKEALVMSGALFMNAVARNNATLLPIDSEHNAIFQSMANGNPNFSKGIKKILLTASGGPFLNKPLDEFSSVTPAEACAHPNWDMGKKISVDSATMMNKGLEFIEARWLFDTPVDQIEIVVHPQSIIHSMVEYQDGSIVSQMGNPDMRIPIAHGLSWPDRIDSGVASLDLLAMGPLNFEVLDRNRFPCVALAENAARGKDSEAVVLNAANEIAVEAFLHELIRFTDIPLVVERTLAQIAACDTQTLTEILAIDSEARIKAEAEVKAKLA